MAAKPGDVTSIRSVTIVLLILNKSGAYVPPRVFRFHSLLLSIVVSGRLILVYIKYWLKYFQTHLFITFIIIINMF